MALLWNVVKLQGRHLLTGTMNGGGSRTPSSQLFFTAKKKRSYSLSYSKTFRHPQKATTIIFIFWSLPPYLTVGFSASLLPTQRQDPHILFFLPLRQIIFWPAMTLNLGVLGLREQKECIHGYGQQRPAFKPPFQLALPFLLGIKNIQGLQGSKQEGRHHIGSVPNLLYQQRKQSQTSS